MEKEIEYLKSRGTEIKEPNEITWENGLKIFNEMCIINDTIKDRMKKVEVIPIKENEEFDVYTYSKIRSDSTLLFDLENIAKTISHIVFGQTYDKRKYNVEDLFMADKIVYKVGNIICNGYVDENAIDFRKWVHEVFIPYKIEIIK